jgi:hypothetical protein
VQLCVVVTGAEGVGDLVPGVAVRAGVEHEVGQEAFGLLDQAGDQGHRGEVVAEPDPAVGGERIHRTMTAPMARR